MKMLNFRYYMMTTTFFMLFLKKYTDSWKENSFNDVIYMCHRFKISMTSSMTSNSATFSDRSEIINYELSEKKNKYIKNIAISSLF